MQTVMKPFSLSKSFSMRREGFENENLNDAHLSTHRSKNSSVSFRWKCGQRHKIDGGVFVTHLCQWQACEQMWCILDFNGLPLKHSFEWRLIRHRPFMLALNNYLRSYNIHNLIVGDVLKQWLPTGPASGSICPLIRQHQIVPTNHKSIKLACKVWSC